MEKAIVDRKEKTGKYPAAIVPVALYGMPYKADRIMEIANKYGIPVVEDAAEGFGSRYKGQMLGTFGKYGALSFVLISFQKLLVLTVLQYLLPPFTEKYSLYIFTL